MAEFLGLVVAPILAWLIVLAVVFHYGAQILTVL